tara:strand:- start:39 stop:431 length:393 start_codon:yes stop_codon:yes gene_type:complete
MQHELKLVSLDELCETEEHNSIRTIQLANRIKDLKVWTVPIAIEYSTYGIMDGHHRFNAAKLLNFTRVPCVLLDYKKGRVKLTSWRADWEANVEDIFIKIKQSKKFPYKTTRHIFDPQIEEINVSISLLY